MHTLHPISSRIRKLSSLFVALCIIVVLSSIGVVCNQRTKYNAAVGHLRNSGFTITHPRYRFSFLNFVNIKLLGRNFVFIDGTDLQGNSDYFIGNGNIADDLMVLKDYIRELSLPDSVEIDSKVMALLGQMRMLQTLRFSGPHISDSDFSSIRHLKQLRLLQANVPMVTDNGCRFLVECPQLWHLQLSGATVSESTFYSFSNLNLFSLDLSKANVVISSFSLRKCHPMPLMKSLNMSNVSYEDLPPDFFMLMPNIDKLNLSNTNISSESYTGLTHLSNLRYLTMDRTDTTNEDVKHIFNACPKLQYLSLEGCNVSHSAFQGINRLPTSLVWLNLQATQVSNIQVLALLREYHTISIPPNSVSPDQEWIPAIEHLNLLRKDDLDQIYYYLNIENE